MYHCAFMRPGVFLLETLGWDASPAVLTDLSHSNKFASTHLHLGEERHCESN